jgi:hypothetical protein
VHVKIQPMAEEEPFIIRGHHLDFFIDLNSKERAEATAMVIQGTTALRRIAEDVLPLTTETENQLAYAHDVIGPPERSEEFISSLSAVFNRFVMLPDEAPVELVEGIKDEICQTCAVGNHCTRLYLWHDDIPAGVLVDWNNLRIFLEKSNDLNLSSLIEEKIEKASFTDSDEDIPVRRLQTTAGVVRSVMSAWFKTNPVESPTQNDT